MGGGPSRQPNRSVFFFFFPKNYFPLQVLESELPSLSKAQARAGSGELAGSSTARPSARGPRSFGEVGPGGPRAPARPARPGPGRGALTSGQAQRTRPPGGCPAASTRQEQQRPLDVPRSQRGSWRCRSSPRPGGGPHRRTVTSARRAGNASPGRGGAGESAVGERDSARVPVRLVGRPAGRGGACASIRR